MEITKTFYPKNGKAWRAWLIKNHAKAKEIWLVYDRKHANKNRLTYQEALDEALCFGWIDGQAKGVDGDRYAQRFTPRKEKSPWSTLNVKHYARLLKQGKVHASGKAAYARRHRVYDAKGESVIYQIKKEFEKKGNPKKAKLHERFFKTKKGEYGAGDRFYGVTVPETRTIAKKYQDTISFSRISYLLMTGKHDIRLAMLIILVHKFKKGDAEERKRIFDFYIKHLKWINNWDLVDASAPMIVGGYLHNRLPAIRSRLARSSNLWAKRIAMVSTFYSIQQGDDSEAYRIAHILLRDRHDLIHKAVGWMLREAGKRVSEPRLERFIKRYAKIMPRTTLRYAIERFSKKKRKMFMAL